MESYRPTILVADDTIEILEDIVSKLELNYNVIKKTRGDDARDRIISPEHMGKKNSGLDFLILDANMPGFHGEAIAMDAKSFYPDLPIVIYTTDSPSFYSQIQKSGVKVFCKEQMTTQELVDYVHAELSKTQQKSNEAI